MTILITGGAGFIGSAFVRLIVKERPDWKIVVYDKLTYAGNLKNLAEVDGKFVFIQGDIADREKVHKVLRDYEIDQIVNFAAETHVDRSIMSGLEFIETDVLGTYNLLTEAREKGIERYLQVSTDEVYGSIVEGKWTEESPILPNSPYSASKAGGDMQVRAAFRTYNQPVLITRASNNYGPYIFPEKAMPLFITNLLENKKMPIYGDGLSVRDYLYVDDHCRGILAVLEKGTFGEIYNIGSEEEFSTLDLANVILREMDKGSEMIEYVKDRPGHDRRYALDSSKTMQLGWKPQVAFADGIKTTIEWFKANTAWWKPLKDGSYKEYYRQQYQERK
ncbi:MAG: dTDP-glucose 4,6-dehydratase [bacterium]|nr:dTDP-glucose 4,6-dehydratase [bacterium]